MPKRKHDDDDNDTDTDAESDTLNSLNGKDFKIYETKNVVEKQNTKIGYCGETKITLKCQDNVLENYIKYIINTTDYQNPNIYQIMVTMIFYICKFNNIDISCAGYIVEDLVTLSEPGAFIFDESGEIIILFSEEFTSTFLQTPLPTNEIEFLNLSMSYKDCGVAIDESESVRILKLFLISDKIAAHLIEYFCTGDAPDYVNPKNLNYGVTLHSRLRLSQTIKMFSDLSFKQAIANITNL